MLCSFNIWVVPCLSHLRIKEDSFKTVEFTCLRPQKGIHESNNSIHRGRGQALPQSVFIARIQQTMMALPEYTDPLVFML